MKVIEESRRHPVISEVMSFMDQLQTRPQGLFRENELLRKVEMASILMLEDMPAKVAHNLVVGPVGMVKRLDDEHYELKSVLQDSRVKGKGIDRKVSVEAVDMYWFIAMTETLRLFEGESGNDLHAYAQACLYELGELARREPGFAPGAYIDQKLVVNRNNYVSKLYAVKDNWDIKSMAKSSVLSDQKLRKLRDRWSDSTLPKEVGEALGKGEAEIPAKFAAVTGATEAYAEAYEAMMNIYNSKEI